MNLTNFKEERKYQLIKFISSLMLIFGSLLMLYLIYVLINYSSIITNNDKFVRMLVYFVFSFFSGVQYILLNRKNAELIYVLTISVCNALCLLIVGLYGITQVFAWAVFITIINSLAIVYSFKTAYYYAIFVAVSMYIIVIIHNLDLYTLSIDYIDSNPTNTFVLCFFLWLNVNIAKIGYEEIEYSYAEALKYSRKLKKINKRLDQEVIERTNELVKNWGERVKALERFSTVGRITSTLLHDIKTPLSSMSISMELLKDNAKKEDLNKLENINFSYQNLLEMIHDTELLIKNKEEIARFSIEDTIKNALNIMESKLNKHNIQVATNLSSRSYTVGVQVIMLRIILNLLMNSVEELCSTNNVAKKIDIELTESDHHIILNIKDNGRGISKNVIDHIFDEGFSMKSAERNYGLGLYFVKTSLEQYFNGEIKVESQKGSYTNFILDIPINEKLSK